MILAPGVPGVAFGTIADGDGRTDLDHRGSISAELGIPTDWATVSQVHGSDVVVVDTPGHKGDADGLFTTQTMLPLTVATADCVPVALVGAAESVAVVHAGWRGVANGVVVSALAQFGRAQEGVAAAVIGPHIGSCCYEVGDEVVDAVGGYVDQTRWGTRSVDLSKAIASQLQGVPTTVVNGCTMEDERFASHRENATPLRQVAVVWKP